MRLPTRIDVVCKADDTPLKGAMANLTIKVRRKNHFHVLIGPTDDRGAASIGWPEIQASAEADRDTFVMDYTGLGDATGELEIKAQNREAIDRALAAYEVFHHSATYPTDYAENLRRARAALDLIAPATLNVEVEQDGEGITVHTLAVEA